MKPRKKRRGLRVAELPSKLRVRPSRALEREVVQAMKNAARRMIAPTPQERLEDAMIQMAHAAARGESFTAGLLKALEQYACTCGKEPCTCKA